jgi:hypothetical protein
MQEAELAIGSDIQIIPIAVQLRRRDEVESIALSQGLKTMEIDDDATLYAMRDEVLDPIYDSKSFRSVIPIHVVHFCSQFFSPFHLFLRS